MPRSYQKSINKTYNTSKSNKTTQIKKSIKEINFKIVTNEIKLQKSQIILSKSN